MGLTSFVIIGVLVSIDCSGCNCIAMSARLRCRSIGRNILSVTEDFHFGKGQDARRAGEFDPDKASVLTRANRFVLRQTDHSREGK
jgi:hypothetical protein